MPQSTVLYPSASLKLETRPLVCQVSSVRWWSLLGRGGVFVRCNMRNFLILLACSSALALKPSSQPALHNLMCQCRSACGPCCAAHPRAAMAAVLHGPYPLDARPGYLAHCATRYGRDGTAAVEDVFYAEKMEWKSGRHTRRARRAPRQPTRINAATGTDEPIRNQSMAEVVNISQPVVTLGRVTENTLNTV